MKLEFEAVPTRQSALSKGLAMSPNMLLRVACRTRGAIFHGRLVEATASSFVKTPQRCSTTGAFRHLDKLIIETRDDALEIASRLNIEEQRLLKEALIAVAAEKKHEDLPLTSDQVRGLFIVNALPFIGFGTLDNMIMILAGEYIDQKLGTVLCISTMAAAALGNLISDIAGVGLAHYVEIGVHKAGIKHPVLTPEQMESSKARYTTNMARACGLTIGCLIGMFPLLFFDDEDKKNEN
ncbi:unnamed protein product [Caenorhabditis auriculariae]|uniref:Transmembrane protein 65 n=1 Tax=Caenorhabditis auriculariae TaxID=2777116 RepID=A0A8S1H4Q7_9PELO|nr:unnamed protein product [Caenorhabditis auriculariae]